MKTKVQKWGNSLAVRIPKGLADDMLLGADTTVDITAEDGRLLIVPARRRISLDELVAGITEENKHGETDWGPPVGREVIE